MANMALSGGRAQVDFFRIDASTSGLMTVLQGLSGSSVATTNAHKAFSAKEIVSTAPAFQEDGTVKIVFENYEDTSEFNDFLNTLAVPAASTTGALPNYTLENGTERTTASNSNNLVLAIYYGAQTGATVSDKTKSIVALGSISPTSGSWTSKNDDWTKPTLEFSGTKAGSILTVGAGLFDSTLVTQGAALTIAKNTCFLRKFLTNAA